MPVDSPTVAKAEVVSNNDWSRLWSVKTTKARVETATAATDSSTTVRA